MENNEIKAIDKLKTKKKKKRIIWISIIGVIVLVCVGFGVYNSMTPTTVSVAECSKDSISQRISVSGTIKATESKTYYAGISGQIDEVNVRKGDTVSKGTVLFTYNEEKINNDVELANLKLQASEGAYDNSIQSNGKTLYRVSEANVNLDVLDTQIADWDAYVQDLEKKIQNKQNELARQAELLQISLIDWRDKPDSTEYINLQKLVQENQYEQSHNAQIQAWQTELNKAKEELAEFKSYRSQMRSQENSSKDSSMTKGAKAELEANLETAKVQAENSKNSYADALGGIKADFDGVITSVDAISGSTVNEGTALVSMDNINTVVVRIELTKYDLERVAIGQIADITINGKNYTGKVAKISKVAEKNQSGSTVVAAEISIDNPDDNVIIGFEAQAKILVGEHDDVVVVSNDMINYDSEGAFVWAVKDDLVTKQRIETGLSDDNNTEVVSGLNVGDQIIIGNTDYLEEGTQVKTIVEGN